MVCKINPFHPSFYRYRYRGSQNISLGIDWFRYDPAICLFQTMGRSC